MPKENPTQGSTCEKVKEDHLPLIRKVLGKLCSDPDVIREIGRNSSFRLYRRDLRRSLAKKAKDKRTSELFSLRAELLVSTTQNESLRSELEFWKNHRKENEVA